MLKRRLRKSHDEFLWDLMDSYRNERGGGFRMEDLSQWILDNDLLPPPHISAERLLTGKLKQAARRRRFRDAQGRIVRKVLAAKFERVDANGNRVFEVIWDYLHETSLNHLLTSFSLRDENIEKQRLAATRDVQSAIDNNPNAAGHANEFVFGFMLDKPADAVEEKVAETNVLPPTDQHDERQPNLISKRKPR
jgi:hypothetical protein